MAMSSEALREALYFEVTVTVTTPSFFAVRTPSAVMVARFLSLTDQVTACGAVAGITFAESCTDASASVISVTVSSANSTPCKTIV